MTLFTELYNKYIVSFVQLYEIDWKYLDDDTMMYRMELEFNEERGIEIELHLRKNDIIDGLYIFHMMVQDARSAENNRLPLDDCEEFFECNLAARKLKHLIGEELYDKFMTCSMDYNT